LIRVIVIFLRETNGQSSLVQSIDLESFSVLIDNNQAIYNLSASGVFTDLETIAPLSHLLRFSLHSYSLDTSGFCIIENIF
jgi:hypothetical protein